MFFAKVGTDWRGGRGSAARFWSEAGHYRLAAHEWRGTEWRHDVMIVHPSWASGLDGCFLEVTGDNAGEVDLAYAKELAESSGLPVAVLFQVPNQPLWEMVEDDLIASTFERFLETGDQEWPLLVPMVRSVLAAMDALEREFGFDRFLVGGASKRGWTSWLTAATGDPRVAGIVPLVFDNLRMDLQMKRQMELWGRPSDMVDDYARRQLHLIEQSARGPELLEIVDPWRQLASMNSPALVVNGANDAYWAVDALGLYYGDLPTGSGAVVVPNLGHSTGGRTFWGPALYRFARAVLGGGLFPTVSARWEGARLEWGSSMEPSAIRVWTADSDGPSFWDRGWERTSDFERGDGWLEVLAGGDRYRAALAEFEFRDDEGYWRLTSPAAMVAGP